MIEGCDLLFFRNQIGAQHRPEVLPAADIHELERMTRIDDLAEAYFKARCRKDSGKGQEIGYSSLLADRGKAIHRFEYGFVRELHRLSLKFRLLFDHLTEVQLLTGDLLPEMMEIFAVFEDASHRLIHRFLIQLVPVQGHQSRGPIQRLRDPRALIEIHLPHLLHKSAYPLGQMGADLGKLGCDDLILFFKSRIIDPMVETAPLEGVVNLPRTVRGQKNVGPKLGANRSDLRYRDLEVREDLQQKGFKFHVRTIDLVDKQNGWSGAVALNRLQERPLNEIFLGEDLGLYRIPISSAHLFELDAQHLLGIVPFVERIVGIQSLVALETDEFCLHDLSQHFGDLGLADARLSLEQHGFPHSHRKINDGR